MNPAGLPDSLRARRHACATLRKGPQDCAGLRSLAEEWRIRRRFTLE